MKKIIDKMKEILKDKNSIKVLISLTLILAIVALLQLTTESWKWSVDLFITAVMPFLLSFMIAYVLRPFVNKIQKYVHKRGLAVLITILCLVGIIILCLVFIVPEVIRQFALLADYVGQGANSLFKLIDTNVLSKLDLQQSVMDYIKNLDLFNNLQSILMTLSNQMITVIINLISSVVYWMFSFILIIYFLIYDEPIRKGTKKVLTFINPSLPDYIRNADHELQKFLGSFGLIMLSKFPIYGFLFYLIGHKNWLILAILNVFAVIIPYVGPLTANAIALLTGISQGQGVVLGTVGVIAFSSFIDPYLIEPRIYKSQLEMNPLVILFVIFVGSTFFGLIGTVAGIPSYVMIRSLINTYRSKHADSALLEEKK